MIDEILDDLYHLRYNVGIGAKKADVDLEEIKRLLRLYVLERPMEEDEWSKDVELGWPWA